MAKLSASAVKQIKEIISRYRDERTPLMMILSDIQKEYGYIPLDVQELVSSSDNEYGYEFSFSKEILYDSTGNRINKIEMMGITQKNELLNADTITISYQE